MLKKKSTTFKEMLLNGEQVIAPSVWDCYSAKAAEAVGYKALLLSGAAAASSLTGTPDLGLMTVDELIWITERICAYSPLPVIVDFDEGYGDSPINIFRNVERLVRAGAQGFTLDDGMGKRGWARLKYGEKGKVPYEVVPTEILLGKVKAALAATEGTDCVVIARTESRPINGFDDAIDRMARAADIGAPMTLINRYNNIEECRLAAEKIPGWKLYPDITVVDGKPDVEMDEIMALNYNFVTMHYLEKGAMWGMMHYGRENIKNGNAVYSEMHDMGGLTPEEQLAARQMDPVEWLELEKEFMSFLKK